MNFFPFKLLFLKCFGFLKLIDLNISKKKEVEKTLLGHFIN